MMKRIGRTQLLRTEVPSPAYTERLAFLITEDALTLYRYCQDLRTQGVLSTRPIKLVDGFDKSYFDPAQQQTFEVVLENPPPTPPEAKP